MLEVALSGLLLDYPNSGTATYTRNLVACLPAAAPDMRFRLFVRNAALMHDKVEVQRLTTPFDRFNRGGGLGARLDKLSWETAFLPVAATLRGESLLHSLYFAAPPVSPMPLVVTIHDLITLAIPRYHRSRQGALYSRFMARTARRARAIITVSHHSAGDIVRLLGVPNSRIHVTYEAVDTRFVPEPQPGELERVRARYGLPAGFVLYTGGAERRKNIETLVRAWARVNSHMRRRDVRLTIVARFPPPEPLYPDIPTLVRELGLENDVCFVSAIAEEDKPALYRAAMAFAFPSSYEGFGFTPLEAMASGLPVLASNATSVPEVVSDGGWLLPPDDVAGWADALRTLVDSARVRTELRHRGLRRARQFSWERTAQETVRVYREVLGA